MDGGAGKGKVDEVEKDALGRKAPTQGDGAGKNLLGSKEEKQGEGSKTKRKRGLGATDLLQLEAKKKKEQDQQEQDQQEEDQQEQDQQEEDQQDQDQQEQDQQDQDQQEDDQQDDSSVDYIDITGDQGSGSSRSSNEEMDGYPPTPPHGLGD